VDKSAHDRIAHREKFHFWHVGRREIISDQLSRKLARQHDNQILDIGCGPGGNISALKQFGRVTGLDVSDDALAYTKAAGYDNVIQSDVAHTPFADSTFDVVSSLDVFEHVPDDIGIMRECYRVLKQNGILITTVPAHPFLWSENDAYLAHVRRYTTHHFLLQLEIAHLVPITYSHFITLGVPGILLRKFLGYIMPSHYSGVAFDKDFSPKANSFFLTSLRIEKMLMRYIKIPFGSSLLVIAQKGA
jgi:SAM-dependent methyltransferase